MGVLRRYLPIAGWLPSYDRRWLAGDAKAVGYTAALALAAGAVYVALGLLRVGWISNFLSKAVMSGFVLGFAIGIVIDQSHALLGVAAPDGTYVEELWGTIKEIPDADLTTLAVGAGSLGLLRRLRPTEVLRELSTPSRVHARLTSVRCATVLRVAQANVFAIG